MRSDSTEKGPQEGEKLYRMLFDYSMDGIILVDPRDGGKVLSANQAACQMLGWTEEELIGKGRDVMFDLEDPALSSLLEERALSGSVRAQLTYRRKDGTTFPGEVSTAFFTGDNGEPRAVAIIRDITESKQAEEALRKSEERYRTLFTNMTEGFFLGEPIYDNIGNPCDYRFLEVNPAFELQTGLKREQLLGKTIQEILHNPNRLAIEEYGRVALTGKSMHVEVYSEDLDRYLDNYIFSPEKGKFAVIFRDITERKQAEEALRESETRFRTMFEAHGAPMLLIEPDSGQIIDANDAAARFYEYSREQLRVMRIDEINQLPPEEVTAERYRAVERGKNVFIFRHRLASGDVRWVEVYSSPVTIKGQPILFSIIHDITERKWAEEALKGAYDTLEEKVKERTTDLEKAYNSLKESEKNLAEAQRMAHIGSWEWDIETGELHWSDEVYRIFGRNPQEFGATFDNFLSYLHPEDRDYVYKSVKKALNGEFYNIDFRVISADGEERIVDAHGEVVFNEENIPVRMRGTVQDITENKKAEERIQHLADIVESSNDAIITKTLEGIITSWNKGAEQIYGYSAEEIIGKNISILEPENLKGEIKKLTQKIIDDENVKHYETLRLRKDGKLINISVTLSPIFSSSGKLVAISAIARDITERKKAEEALARMEKIRIKEIHHRIKNNLQVISSLLDLQSEAFSHLEVCKVPEVIEAFTESQNRVVSMALIHEELYKGEKIDALDFSAYLRKLTEELFSSYNLGNKDISFKLDLEQVDIGMDAAIPLGIIVNELVSNAFKHAFPERREGEIRINLRRIETTYAGTDISSLNKECMEKNGFQYKLEVSDNGNGIPEEMDIENSNSLGLQLVSLLIEQIDGCVEVKRDEGTEFTIWFNDIDG